MIRPSFARLALIAFGLIVGGSLHYFGPEKDGAEDSTLTEVPSLQDDNDVARESELFESDTLPRPTLEEVMAIRGLSDSLVLARYLKDATLDETIALLDAFAQQPRFLDIQWMVQMRGLELEPEEMLSWAKAKNSHSLSSLFRTWAELDPKAALEASLNEAPRMRQAVIHVLRGRDPDEAIAIISAVIPDAPELKEFENLKWAQLAAVDVHAALEGVMAIEDVRERRRNLSEVLEQWAKTDPLAVVQWLEKEEGFEGGDSHIGALRILAETQPSLAWSKAQKLSPSIRRSGLEKSIAKGWAVQDPDAALTWVKSLPNGPRRMDYFASMAEHLDVGPEELLNLVKEFGAVSGLSSSPSALDLELSPTSSTSIITHGDNVRQAITRAVFELANESPQKAFEAICDHIGIDYRSVESVAQLWVERDPDEAASWTASLPENDFTKNIQQAVFRSWVKESVEASAAFLKDNEITDKLNLSLMVAREWVASDADAAISWADQLEEGVRETVFRQTLTEVASVDPMQALQYVNQVEDPATQQTILAVATNAWRQSDPEGSMQWLQDQPTDANIEGILKDNAKAWVLSEPQAASEWIGSMEAGPRRDHAVAGMVHALISSTNPSKDFEAAESWVHEINDLEIQQQWIDEINKRRP